MFLKSKEHKFMYKIDIVKYCFVPTENIYLLYSYGSKKQYLALSKLNFINFYTNNKVRSVIMTKTIKCTGYPRSSFDREDKLLLMTNDLNFGLLKYKQITELS